MVTDHDGKLSSMRIAFLIYVVVVCGVWAYVCVLNKTMVEIPMQVITMGGALAGGKVAQSFAESQKK